MDSSQATTLSASPILHNELALFQNQLNADIQAGVFRPHLTFDRWMAAKRYYAREHLRNRAHANGERRRPRLRWSRFPPGHSYLLQHLPQWSFLKAHDSKAHDRRRYLQHVIDDFLDNRDLMAPLREKGYSERDVDLVSTRIRVFQRRTLAYGLKTRPLFRGSVTWNTCVRISDLGIHEVENSTGTIGSGRRHIRIDVPS